jgi:hypothetical protein
MEEKRGRSIRSWGRFTSDRKRHLSFVFFRYSPQRATFKESDIAMIDVEAQSAGILGKILVRLNSQLQIPLLTFHPIDARRGDQRTRRAGDSARCQRCPRTCSHLRPSPSSSSLQFSALTYNIPLHPLPAAHRTFQPAFHGAIPPLALLI